MSQTRRLAAILAADVAGYSRLIGADESGTLERLKAVRRELLDPKIAEHRGRLVKTTGDGLLVEFASVVDALRCAVEVQREMTARDAGVPPDSRIEFRIGINMGDIVVEDGDIFGDGVNVAARLEALAEPGGICVAARVQEDAAGKLDLAFADIGEQQLKNIARPVRAYRVITAARPTMPQPGSDPPLPDKPSIAVLPFANMSSDPEQEFLADGIAEDVITALSRYPSLFVIARNSSFTYKGRAVDVKQVGRELGVRYVLEGSLRKSGDRIRVTAQCVEAQTGSMSGPSATTAISPTSSQFKTRSPKRRRSLLPRRSPMPSASVPCAGRRQTSMPGPHINGDYGISGKPTKTTTYSRNNSFGNQSISTPISPAATVLSPQLTFSRLPSFRRDLSLSYKNWRRPWPAGRSRSTAATQMLAHASRSH